MTTAIPTAAYLLVACFGLTALSATAADPRSELPKRVYRNAAGETLPYRIFIPEKLDPQMKYPLIVFLHGAGERGTDNDRQLVHAEVLRFVSPEVRAKQPCFLIAPQCPEGKKWQEIDWSSKAPIQLPEKPSQPMGLLLELLDTLYKELPIDANRRYVTGLSMGGYGTFDLLMRRPNDFAAAIPICGGADDSRAKSIADIPLWIFHGSADGSVPVVRSRSIVAALKEAGGNPKYTEYPGMGHNVWSKAYQEPELVDWLLSQKKK